MLNKLIIHVILAVYAIGQTANAVQIFNLPVEYRQYNASGSDCVHCSVVNNLRINGQYREAAEFWRRYGHSGVDDPQNLSAKLNQLNLKYRMTLRGNKAFILQAISEGYSLAVGLRRQHMLNIVGADETEVVLLGNKNTDYYKRESWEEFLPNFDGWAVVMLRPQPEKIW